MGRILLGIVLDEIMIRLIIFFACLLMQAPVVYSFIGDVERYRDEKNEDGVTLSSLINSFSEYGEHKDNFVRIVILGAVKRPGIYYMEASTSLLEAIKKAGVIEYSEHPAHTYLRRVNVFRKGYESPLVVNATTELNPPIVQSGDVINVLAFLL